MASLNLSLPEGMRQYLDAKADSGVYATPSEFVRDLIRRNMEKEGVSEMVASTRRGLSDIEQGRTHPFDAEKIRKQAKAALKSENK